MSTDRKPKLDLPQRIERSIARLNTSENPLRRWSIELISWTTSALCMGSIIGILLHIENQRLSQWPLGLTIITILAKIAAATLIIPTSEAIGQLKWNWYNGSKSKEMVDFEIFDKASRGGPWGSVMLILRTKGKSLAALGAVLTILMLAIDTFFQQVIELPDRWVLQAKALVPVVSQYEPKDPHTYSDGMKELQNDRKLLEVVEKFFIDNGTQPIPAGNGTQAEIHVLCPTGNCEWPTYHTLGICSACEDVSSLLKFTCISSRMDWIRNLTRDETKSSYPNGTMCGYFINTTSNDAIMMTGYAMGSNVTYAGQALVARSLPLVDTVFRTTLFDGSIHFGHVRNPIVDFIVAGVQDIESAYANQTPVAHECMLSWCIKAIKSTYHLGAYNEEVVDTFFNSTPGVQPWLSNTFNYSGSIQHDHYYLEDIVIRAPWNPKNTYGLMNSTMLKIAATFDDFLPFFSTMVNTSSSALTRSRYWKTSRSTEYLMSFNPWLPPNNITRHLERIAIMMTNHVRFTSNETAPGDAWAKEVFVSVQWAWLTFPVVLLFTSLLFLITTIVRTSKDKSKVGIWKTSAMPALIYSLPKDVQDSLASGGATWTAIGRDNAKKTRIRLLPNKGWRVSGYNSAPTTPVSTRHPPPGWI
ncbi:hypothetical protein N0V90_007629 [Kalmusia sp. IMI 367209]|nr:hypothetical protein N0V90_007629 [Kalmusia sp. IMI 367209]